MTLSKQIDPENLDAEIHRRILHTEGAGYKHDNPLVTENNKEQYMAMTLPLPKFHIHEDGMAPTLAARLVRQHLNLDGNSQLNLASFVHTSIDPEGLALCAENITKNLADSDEYPALLDLQYRCVSILSNLWHVPSNETGVGTATTGSSEAIMLGGLAMKRRWEAQRKAKGLPYDKPNIIMGANAQVALEKFARYFDVEMRLLDIHVDAHFSFTMEDLRKNCDENTIGVFAILGSTLTGHYQNIVEINETLDEIEKEHGWDISIHVDGASGAFVAPFMSPNLVWDFKIPRVRSINASGHKFGLALVGCGWILWRNADMLPENLLFTLNYLGGSEVTYTLNFSRPGHPIVLQYYSLVKNGFSGYKNIHGISLANARVLSWYLESTDYFDVLSDIHRAKGDVFTKSGVKAFDKDKGEALGNQPSSFFNDGLPVVSFTFTQEFKKKYPYIPQEAVSYMLRDKGYIVPNYPLPKDEEDIEVLRVVINDNVSMDLLDMLMLDIVRIVKRLLSIGNSVNMKGMGAEEVFKTIALISAADHAEEEHQSKWYGNKAEANHSRC